MCQSHLQSRYRRSARTTISVTVNNMPEPSVRASARLVSTNEILPEEKGTVANLFRFTRPSVITQRPVLAIPVGKTDAYGYSPQSARQTAPIRDPQRLDARGQRGRLDVEHFGGAAGAKYLAGAGGKRRLDVGAFVGAHFG